MQIKLIDEDLRLECSPEIFEKQRQLYHISTLYLPPIGVFDEDHPLRCVYEDLCGDLRGHFGYGYVFRQWIACSDQIDNVMTTQQHSIENPGPFAKILLKIKK